MGWTWTIVAIQVCQPNLHLTIVGIEVCQTNLHPSMRVFAMLSRLENFMNLKSLHMFCRWQLHQEKDLTLRKLEKLKKGSLFQMSFGLMQRDCPSTQTVSISPHKLRCSWERCWLAPTWGIFHMATTNLPFFSLLLLCFVTIIAVQKAVAFTTHASRRPLKTLLL